MGQKLRKREMAAYTGGLLGQNMLYNFIAMYIMFFFTDLCGIKPAAATAIVVAASLWDAVNDPLMGMVADRTRSRWGKFRPYLLFGPIAVAVTTVLCFVNFGLKGAAAVAVAALCYVLWGMSYTVCDIPIWAISSVVSKDSDEKNKMVTLGKIGGTVGTALVTVGSILVIQAFGGERVWGAYAKSAVLMAVIGAALMILTGVTLRERIYPAKEVIPMRRNIQTISKNRPLLMLMISLLVVNLVNGIRQSAQMYFVVYVWGDSGQLTNVGISLILGMVLGMAVTPRLLQKLDKKRVFLAACILGSIFSAVPFLAGEGNILFGLIFLGVSFAFTGMTTIASASMLIDAVDYSEWKLGFRGEGLIFSANTFLTKLSGTLAKGILGLGLILMQYQEGQPVTPVTITGFSAMMYVVPALCFLAAMVPLVFYRITVEQKKQIREMLEQKYSGS